MPNPSPSPLSDPAPLPLLWAATFTRPGDTALDRYYRTYAIDSRGQLSGMYTGDALWRLLDEFATIAAQLTLLGLFDEHEALWQDALQAALASPELVPFTSRLPFPVKRYC